MASSGMSPTSESSSKSRTNSSRYPRWTRSSMCFLKAQQFRVTCPRMLWKEQCPTSKGSESRLLGLKSLNRIDAWWHEWSNQSVTSREWRLSYPWSLLLLEGVSRPLGCWGVMPPRLFSWGTDVALRIPIGWGCFEERSGYWIGRT